MENQDTRPPMTGDGFKLWRGQMGFSTREAAAKLGCSRSSIRNWEHGLSPVPHYIALATAALGLGIDATGNAPPPPDETDDEGDET
jgi:transcriptional regulator with XRE-family HTH domain